VITQAALEQFSLLCIVGIPNVIFRLRPGGGLFKFVLREQLSHGDNFMMFRE
jgi:hypothetical protein